MQGTILVIDGVSTNRIMLKVQLAAAYYDAVQAGSVAEVLQTARQCRPDLVLTAMSLPDGTAADVKRELARDEALADLPVIAVSDWEGAKARLEALAAGIDDVLQQPVDDVILQARIRSLLRARSATEELNLQRDASHGFILPLSDRACAEGLHDVSVALVAQDPRTAMAWRDRLSARLPYELRTHAISDIQGLMQAPVADAIIIELNEASAGPGLRLLADLRADLGMTYLFVSHDLQVVRMLCDRVLVMQGGKIVEEGNCETVMTAPTHPVTQALLAATPRLPETAFQDTTMNTQGVAQ